MRNFKVKKGKLFDGDTPVKLLIGDPEQIAFIKKINDNAEQLKSGVPVEVNSISEDNDQLFGIEFRCKCGDEMLLTKDGINQKFVYPDTQFIGAEIECDNCATPYIVIQPNKNINEIEIIINHKKTKKQHEIYSSKLLVE